MATTEIEIRVAALENEIAALKEKMARMERTSDAPAWWQKISGSFADDADYDEAVRLGREYRLSQKEEK
jgi:predicted TIM-barrel fold metal-dependent hydrolase